MNRIKDILEEQGRSQAWLARQINRTPAALNAICQNKAQPSLKLLYKIAEILQVEPANLLGNGSKID